LIPRAVVIRISAGAALSLMVATPSLAVDLKPKTFPLRLLGVEVALPVTISFDARTEADSLDLDVRAQASLKDVQDKALEIARALPVPRGNCDHDGVNPVVNRIDSASIAPSGNTAVVTISGHVTAWLCAHPFGVTAKTVAGSDSVTLTASVEIVTIQPDRVGLKLAGPVSVTTGHALTAEVAQLLAGDIGASLTSRLATALDAADARASFPDLPGLAVNVQSARFSGEGAELQVDAAGTARMSGDTFNSLLELMSK
jgi:hypothetical protein